MRLATRVLAGGDPRDPWWVPVPFDGPALDPPIRVAVTCEAHGYPINPQILAGVDRAADLLSDAGYAVERVATPSIMKPAEAWFDVLASEIVHFLGPAAREHGSETIQTIFEHYQRIGEPVDPAGYRQATPRRRQCRPRSDLRGVGRCSRRRALHGNAGRSPMARDCRPYRRMIVDMMCRSGGRPHQRIACPLSQTDLPWSAAGVHARATYCRCAHGREPRAVG